MFKRFLVNGGRYVGFQMRGLKRHFSKSRFLHPIFFSPFILVMNYFHLLALHVQWLCQQPNVCVVCCSKYCPNTPLKLMYYTVHCTMYTVQCTLYSVQYWEWAIFESNYLRAFEIFFKKFSPNIFWGPGGRRKHSFLSLANKQSFSLDRQKRDKEGGSYK